MRLLGGFGLGLLRHPSQRIVLMEELGVPQLLSFQKPPSGSVKRREQP